MAWIEKLTTAATCGGRQGVAHGSHRLFSRNRKGSAPADEDTDTRCQHEDQH